MLLFFPQLVRAGSFGAPSAQDSEHSTHIYRHTAPSQGVLPGCSAPLVTHLCSPSASHFSQPQPDQHLKLEKVQLRPCPHQVAGHLFEEGKAGSLVDDQGHFYKPIQQGPRGDRERLFYEAIAAALAEEAAQQQALGSKAGGAVHPASVAATRAPLLIRAARLPSIRERGASGDVRTVAAVQIAQRDEFGLLGTPTLRDLRVGSPDWLGRSPDSEGAELTAEHLMDDFHSKRSMGEQPLPPGEGDLLQQGSALHEQQQQPQQQQQPPQQQKSTQQQQRQHAGPSGGSPPVERHAPPSLTDPRHAEAAALLGQPIFDVEYSRPPSLPRLRTHSQQRVAPCLLSMLGPPARQAAGPLSHDYWHQPAPREAQPAAGNAEGLAAVAGEGGEGDAALLEAACADHRGPRPERASSVPYEYINDLLFIAQPVDATSSAEELCAGEPHTGDADLHTVSNNGFLGAAGAGPLGGLALAGQCSAFSPRSDPRLWLSLTEGEEEDVEDGGGQRRCSSFKLLPFSVRNALLLSTIPKFYGVVESEGRTFLELEDLTRKYRRPSIIDIKVGFRTWYPSASQAYIERCQAKDGSTTQASLGFKICGMQVYRHSQGGYWRASKRWCKTLPAELVDKALLSFAHNENGVRPQLVYGGPHGAIAQLQSLETWFELQREFHFYSSSLLILYEGGATEGEDPRVRVRFVDFAHTFKLENGQQQRDHNFLAGLRAIIARLSAVLRAEATDSLA